MDRKSIDAVFHPERPVTDRSQLVGRDAELEIAVDRLSTAGGHLLLYGHRGIGKTSIAQVAEGILRKEHSDLVVRSMSCDVRADFADIARTCLWETRYAEDLQVLRSPVRAANAMADLNGFLIIDELDRLNMEQRPLLGDFMKRLSDRASSFSVCAVGIAQTATELFSGHPSVNRCLNEIHVRKLDDTRLAEIVDIGFLVLRQRVRGDVVVDIARLSLGFPSNAVLLCRYVAEAVLRAPVPVIGAAELRRGLDKLMHERGRATLELLTRMDDDNQGALKKAILMSGAMIKSEEFTHDELFAATRERCTIDRKRFENICLGFCIDGPERVFDEIRSAVLRFHDPRLPMIVFIREFLADPVRKLKY